MADADQAMLRRSGFNAVHLYLWDQPTFYDLYRKQTSRLPEISGFAYPDPALSAARQWDALDEFVGMAEKYSIGVIPHFVHTPFNENLDSLSRAQTEQRAGEIAAWAGRFISRLSNEGMHNRGNGPGRESEGLTVARKRVTTVERRGPTGSMLL